MKSTARTLIAAATLLAAGVAWMPAMACDDTLVMLLTAQNPASEFSKTIRSFTNTLTVLGSALKEQKKASYDSEMKQTCLPQRARAVRSGRLSCLARSKAAFCSLYWLRKTR